LADENLTDEEMEEIDDNLGEEEEKEPLERQSFNIVEYNSEGEVKGYRTESGYFEEPPVFENEEIIDDDDLFEEIIENFNERFSHETTEERVKKLEAELDALLGEE